MLGASPNTIEDIRSGSHSFGQVLRDAKKPMIIVGQGALARPDGGAILAAAWRLANAVGALLPDWHGLNVLHTAAARVGALDLGFISRIAPQDAWPALIDEQRAAATTLTQPALARMNAQTVIDTRDADMAALAHSASVPGLKERIRIFREAKS